MNLYLPRSFTHAYNKHNKKKEIRYYLSRLYKLSIHTREILFSIPNPVQIWVEKCRKGANAPNFYETKGIQEQPRLI